MSTSYKVYGIKPTDEKWKKMKNIWDACMIANVNIPDEVWNFFNNEEPNDLGVEIELKDGEVEELCKDGECNYIVNIEKLPKDIKQIVFNVGW